jgi:hypothetical protein
MEKLSGDNHKKYRLIRSCFSVFFVDFIIKLPEKHGLVCVSPAVI